MISREEAKELLYRHLPPPNLRAHCQAVAAMMEALANRWGEDVGLWWRTGLLHDIDSALTTDEPDKHALLAMELLADAGLPDEALHAIRAHNDHEPRESLLDKALWAADPVTGLITAAALMRPDKSIRVIEAKSIKKKFKSKAFAAGANREQIASCEALDIPLSDFLMLAVDAMGRIEEELGLGEAYDG